MYSITDTTTDGLPTVTLSDSTGDLHATVAPSIGMIVCSLVHRGEELLAQRHGLAGYAATGSTMGIPLLHPWANRLSGLEYAVGDRRVVLDASSPLLHKDGAGLPMHGVLAACRDWRVVERSVDGIAARLSAQLAFGADAARRATFPFPHTLTLGLAVRDATLTVTTTLRPTAAIAVPLSFGFHPYLQLPGVSRADWFVTAPVRVRALLDERMIPTGAREDVALQPGPLGNRTFDDLFTSLERPARFVLAGGGRRIAVTFDDGFPWAQIYAPPGDALICFEPMTAPINALVSGDGLRLADPRVTFTASFAINVSAQ
ncbi:MAG: aldose 1-epimerase [bacterium]